MQVDTIQTDHTHLVQTLSAMMAHLKALQGLVREDTADGAASLSRTDLTTIRNELTTLEQLTREMLYDLRSASDELALAPLPGLPLAESRADVRVAGGHTLERLDHEGVR